MFLIVINAPIADINQPHIAEKYQALYSLWFSNICYLIKHETNSYLGELVKLPALCNNSAACVRKALYSCEKGIVYRSGVEPTE